MGSTSHHVLTTGEVLERLPRVRSPVTLVVDVLSVTDGDVTWHTRAYNGSFPGPTIVAVPGEVVEIRLVNGLRDIGDVGVWNEFHDANFTNLHLHGVHASPQEDDVLYDVAPGEEKTYRYHIPPDHSPGVAWYHAHAHGSAAFQVGGGLAGTFLVEEDPGTDLPPEISTLATVDLTVLNVPFRLTENPAWSGPVTEDKLYPQILLGHNLSDYEGSTNGVYGDYAFSTPGRHRDAGALFVVNGHLRPVVPLVSEEWTRVRLAYASATYWITLDVGGQGETTEKNAAEIKKKPCCCDLRLLAKDGVYVDDPPRRLSAGMLLPPGGRADFLIRCESGGRYDLRVTNNDGGLEKIPFDRTLLTFDSSSKSSAAGAQTVKKLPRWSPKRPCYLRDLRGDRIDERHVLQLVFDDIKYKRQSLRFNERHGRPGVSTSPGSFRINGLSFDSDAPLRDVALGDVLELNLSLVDQHPVHTHVNPYQIVANLDEKNGGYLALGDWHDTLLLRHQSAVVVRIHLATFPGKLLIHCHTLAHEDYGMMTFLNVLAPSSSSDLASSSCETTTKKEHDCWCPHRKPDPAFTLRGDNALKLLLEEPRPSWANPRTGGAAVLFLVVATALVAASFFSRRRPPAYARIRTGLTETSTIGTRLDLRPRGSNNSPCRKTMGDEYGDQLFP